MESPILQRVIQTIKELELTDNQFSKKLGIAQTTMSGYLSGNRKLSLQVIESMLNAFGDIPQNGFFGEKAKCIKL